MATQDDTTFVYDDVSGQVTKETTKLTKNKDVVKNYTYDSAGNKSAFAVKVGDDTKLSLQYTYDGASKLTAVTDEDGKVVDYSYDTDGNLSERTVAGNGMTTTYAYDYQNRLTSLKNRTGSAGVISEYDSEYLVNGQKTKETATVQDKDGKKTTKTSAYTYDLLGRITKEKKTGSEDISYTYDSNNNRKEMTVGNKVTAYKYNKNDELLRTDTLNTDTEEDSVVIYKNDKNGNQLATVNRYEIPSDKKDSSYVDIDVTLGDNRLNENVVNHYNALNQLTQTLTKNYKVSFTYDAEGLRTSKTVNGEKTFFVWDGDQLVMELSESGKVQKRYIRGNDLVYADKGENTEKQYYVTDPHGNVVQLTDESGKVTKTYEYDSFGNEVNPDSKDDNPFRYCGEYYDKETEEIYLRARYYQPEVGRFLTRDTYTGKIDEPLSLHLYTYCENDGVNAWDPSGHKKYGTEEDVAGISLLLNNYLNIKEQKKSKTRIGKQKNMGKTYHWPKDDTGKKWSSRLEVCTDGAIAGIHALDGEEANHYYGDDSHLDSLSNGSNIASDRVPYVVITVGANVRRNLMAYYNSLAVITCGKNIRGTKVKRGDYLYCAVIETHNTKGAKMGEVSIYAAWKVLGMRKEEHIANSFPENRGKWKIDIFQRSCPKGGWGNSNKKMNRQLKKHGKKCYIGKGKCLN